MPFAFDPDKEAANIAKHGLSLAVGALVFEGRYLLLPGVFRGEARWLAIGPVEERLLAVVHTNTDGLIRLISVRYASRQERRIYAQNE